MATLSFPTSPTLGQIYTFGLKTWVWTGTAWALQTAGAINNIPIGNSIPSTGAFSNLTGANISGNYVSIVGNVLAGNVQGGNVVLTGNTIGGTNTITMTSANVIFAGNVLVQGNTTFVNANAITTNSLLIQLANNATLSSAANNAGITVGANANIFASILYNDTANVWGMNIGISAVGNITGNNFITSSNVYSGNVLTTGIVSATGNITGNNINSLGFISATGNIIINSGSRLGIGTSTPDTNLTVLGYPQTIVYPLTGYSTTLGTDVHISGQDNSNTRIVQDAFGASSHVAFTGRAARGTSASPAGTQTGDILSQFTGRGFSNGTFQFGNVSTGIVEAVAAEDFTDTSRATNIQISTTAPGAITPTTIATFSSVNGLSIVGNITSANLLTAGLVSATSTITSAANIIGGNILTAGDISATGNIFGSFYNGNGSLLTGVVATGVGTLASLSVTGNANVGNVNSAGLVSATGNITSAANIILTGTGNINGYNGYFSNNLTVLGTFQSTSNITANGAGIFYGDITTGNNALFAGVPGFTPLGSNVVLQVAGNANSYSQINFQNINNGTAATTEIVITANNGNDIAYFGDFGVASNSYANTSPFNSLGTSVSPNDVYVYAQGNSNGGGGNLIVGSNELNGVVRIIANGSNVANIVATFANGGVSVTGIVSATGNITGGNIRTAGLLTATGNITGGNVLTGGNVSATGNIIAGNLVLPINGQITTPVGSNGNLIIDPDGSGNVNITGNVSSTGNISANYFIGNGSQLTGVIAGSPISLVNGTTNITTALNGNANVTIAGTSNVVVWATNGEYVTGNIYSTNTIFVPYGPSNTATDLTLISLTNALIA